MLLESVLRHCFSVVLYDLPEEASSGLLWESLLHCGS